MRLGPRADATAVRRFLLVGDQFAVAIGGLKAAAGITGDGRQVGEDDDHLRILLKIFFRQLLAQEVEGFLVDLLELGRTSIVPAKQARIR